MKKTTIFSLIFTLLLMMTSNVYAYDTNILLKSAVTDPVNKQIIISGNINMAGDRPVLITMYSEDNEIKFSDIVTSDSDGNFNTAIGVDGLPDGEYKVFAKYRNSQNFELYTFRGLGALEPVKIQAELGDGNVFMKDADNVDTQFDTMELRLKNAKVLKGTLKSSGYEISGLPDGMSADITADTENTLKIKFSGKSKYPITENTNISLKLKSSIIYGGEANTDSDMIQGITLYPYTYGQSIVTDTDSVTLKMDTLKTPSSSGVVVNVKYRNLLVDGVLELGTHYTYDKTILSGMALTVTANKNQGALQIKLTGSSTADIEQKITISDFVLKSCIAENATLDSKPFAITITPSSKQTTAPSTDKGSGGNQNRPDNSVVETPPTVDIEPIVPIIAAKLTDIENHWAKDYIQKLNSLGYIEGYMDNTYRPDNNITRAEFTALVLRVMKIESVRYANSFSDISEKDWYSGVIQAALDNGIVSKSEYFRPNDYIRRDEIVKIAVSAYLKEHTSPDMNVSMTTITDRAEIEEWAKEYVQIALNLGIISGYDDGSFRAANTATRGEAAAIIARLIDCLGL